MHQTLLQDKFKDADFMYDNIFFQIPVQNTQIRLFWFQIQKLLLFSQNVAVKQIWGCWFQLWQKFFKILGQKYLHEAFLVPNLGIFIFSRNFAIRQIRRCCFKIWHFCFQIPAQKYPNLRHFFSFAKFCN